MSIQRSVKNRTQTPSPSSAAIQQREDTLSDPLQDPLQKKEEVQHQPMEEEEEELMAKGDIQMEDDVQHQPMEEEEEELMAKGDIQMQEEEEEMLQTKGDLQHQAEEEEEPIQTKGGRAAQVHATANKGVSGSGGGIPHGDKIQAAFGSHDVSGVQAHTDSAASAANEQMGSQAFAKGEHVAFKGSPDLHTAAHEAAHVVQQRQGVNLQGGVGKSGDSYERNADAVADAVVQGKSAEGLLGGGKAKKK